MMDQTDKMPDRLVRKTLDDERPFVTRQIAGETIVVPVCQSVADLGAIYTLNQVGSRVWHLIDGPTRTEAITARICEEYEVPADQAAADVATFLDELAGIGLIRFVATDDGR